MEATGKLHKKFEAVQATEKFRRRQFVIEYRDNPLYPQYVSFELTQDKCSAIDGLNEGDMVDVQFNLRGREWKSPQGEVKYFNTLEAWRVIPADGSKPVVANQAQLIEQDASDDLPF